MSMTAAELFEVVKDVPREVWPELTWDGVEWSNSRRDEDISARIAEHAFIGSMTAWLARNKKYSTFSTYSDGTSQVALPDRCQSIRASSLVAALAAACKEAA